MVCLIWWEGRDSPQECAPTSATHTTPSPTLLGCHNPTEKKTFSSVAYKPLLQTSTCHHEGSGPYCVPCT